MLPTHSVNVKNHTDQNELVTVLLKENLLNQLQIFMTKPIPHKIFPKDFLDLEDVVGVETLRVMPKPHENAGKYQAKVNLETKNQVFVEQSHTLQLKLHGILVTA